MGKVKTEKTKKSDRVKKGGIQKQQGLRFNKEFGQHILKNPMIVTSMIEKVCEIFN